jgi:malonate decarboxylase epsilon subunit
VSIALLFPGQGSQTAGFLRALPTNEIVLRTLEEATSTLGFDVLTLDSEEGLRGTVAAQLALLVAGVAFARFVIAAQVEVAVAAGMSVGVFAAAVAANAVTFTEALGLVRRRAELMDDAFPDSTHGMAVLEGMTREQIEQLIAEEPIAVANENAAMQFVVAGRVVALQRICSLATEQGASRAQMLRIAVPSHSPWLLEVSQRMREAVDKAFISAPAFPLLANRNGRRITNANSLREELASNMAWPVNWRDVMSLLDGSGVSLYLEAPPGHTLAGLVHANLADASALSASEMRWESLLRAAHRSNAQAI